MENRIVILSFLIIQLSFLSCEICQKTEWQKILDPPYTILFDKSIFFEENESKVSEICKSNLDGFSELFERNPSCYVEIEIDAVQIDSVPHIEIQRIIELEHYLVDSLLIKNSNINIILNTHFENESVRFKLIKC